MKRLIFMALGKRKPKQDELFIPTAKLAAGSGHPFQRPLEQPFQPLGDERAAKELGRVLVLVRPLILVHLPEIGGKLGLLITTACHIFMWGHYLTPRL